MLKKQLQDNFEKNLAGVNLVIGAKGSPLQLILCSMYHIDAPTGNIKIGEIRPFMNPRHPLIEDFVPLSLGDSYRNFRIVGTNQNILEWYDGDVERGKVWERNFEVTIGSDVARRLHLHLGDTFQSSHGFMDDEGMEHDDAESFIVVGILAKTGSVLDQLILTTPQTFWLVHDHDHDHEEGDSNSDTATGSQDAAHRHDHGDHAHDHDLDTIFNSAGEIPIPLIQEADEKEITSLLLRFKGQNFQALNMQRSINENTEMQAATPAIEINRLFSMMDNGEAALRLLAMIIIIVSGLSVFISLYSSLSDRKYELALMRVMGGSRTKLFVMIMLEGFLVALLGYLIGTTISHGGMELIGKFAEENYRYNFTGATFLSKEWILLAGALLIGLVAAIIPAIQASNTDISETLVRS